MASPDNLVVIYKELADRHERQGQPQMRDRYLVLAADAAVSAGRAAEADLLLTRLLRANPHHMLRPFTSFAEAMASADIRNYVGELRRTHPPEQAEAEFDALRAGRGTPATNRPTRALPPVAPAADAEDSSEREQLKVYRVQENVEAPRPARAAVPRPPAAPSKAPPRPVRAPVPLAAAVAVAPAAQPPPPGTDADDVARGSWLSSGLFVLLFAAAAALAGWTFLLPFLPHG
jgi:hypothetical protein